MYPGIAWTHRLYHTRGFKPRATSPSDQHITSQGRSRKASLLVLFSKGARHLLESILRHIPIVIPLLRLQTTSMRHDLFIFRHGETDWNREFRYQGHTDIPLNTLGMEQAQSLIPLLNRHKPEIFLSSDLSRARATAEIANQDLKRPVLESKDLRECLLGDSEGMHRDQVLETFGKDSISRWNSVKLEDLDFSFPKGETKADHLKRFRGYLESFFIQHSEYSRIAVSTHGGSLTQYGLD